jgi:2-oxoglutarate ferredoxin oxidoreductase subunit beta
MMTGFGTPTTAQQAGQASNQDKLKELVKLPTTWCPGCGNGIILGAFLRACLKLVDNKELEMKNIVVVSGIGCSGRVTQFLKFSSVHSTHGRAIPLATGIKLANPELKVVVMMGDGDAFAIGGNHFIHAARRNIDLTAIIFNNSLYGMTGGQLSPTTQEGEKTPSSPFGNVERPFNISELAITAGATYVARWTTFHVKQLQKSIEDALSHRGFAVVEVITGCPTRTKKKPSELLKMQKNIRPLRVLKKVEDQEVEEFVSKYYRLVRELGKTGRR